MREWLVWLRTLKHKCNQSDTHGWEVRQMLFNVMVTQVLLYEVEVWGAAISLNTWNEIEKIQKMLESTTSYQVMLFETVVRPIEILTLSCYFCFRLRKKRQDRGGLEPRRERESCRSAANGEHENKGD